MGEPSSESVAQLKRFEVRPTIYSQLKCMTKIVNWVWPLNEVAKK